MSFNSTYSEEYQKQYIEGAFETALVAVRHRQVLEFIRHHPHHRVLDVGCGLDPIFQYLSEDSECVVVEPVPEFAGRAEQLAASRIGVRVIHDKVENAEAAASREGPFDLILLSSLLHEVPNPHEILNTVRRLSSPETITHVNVPNMYSFHRLLAYEMGIISSLFEPSAMEVRFDRKRRFDRGTLDTFLEDAGFEVLSSGSYFIKPFTHEQMDTIIATGAFPPALISGLEAMIRYLPDMGCEIFAEVRPRA